MKEQIKNFLYFSKSEKNGIIVLIALIIILFFSHQIYSAFFRTKDNFKSSFNQEIKDFKSSLVKSENPQYTNRLDNYIIERYDTIELFYFNPNICSNQNFKKLGLTDKQISTIQNYIKKGGKFIEKSDFQKIYGIRNQQYLILKPYILLPEYNNNKNEYNSDNYSQNAENKSHNKDSLFFFDPNNTKKEKWTLLGFNDKQISIIENYINKGGKFNQKTDLKKIYSISEEQYSKVEPYIDITKENTNEISENLFIIELNTATFEDLIKIKGIGNYFANSIIRYREKLGGFINKNQLLEIQNFDKEKLSIISNQITIDNSKIKLIRINFTEIKELVAHPYLNYYQSKEIVNYRNTNGAYTNKKQLFDNKILLKYTYQKIEKYLTID
ncbi:MAG: helix-hairpin-helix domain-containing protein [Bacteroidales bacterium]|nr:helix-hairpin-helix domain-containing protein [Bacteroidales bacterium]MBN2758149.1 helix-hairpin-helix domain-containing protein [Bacteroidales bacterium]